MKENCTLKNLFDVSLGVFFVSWMFFEVVLLGNKVDILSYSGFSGRVIVLFGEIAPAITVYMFMGTWRDVRDARDFLALIFKTENYKRLIPTTLGFFILHTMTMFAAGVPFGVNKLYLIVLLPIMIVSGGLEEIAWRGFFYAGLRGKVSPLLGCILIGFLMGCFSIPLWSIAGTRQSECDFVLYMLYCVYQSIILGTLYRITENVASCILLQAYMHIYLFTEPHLIWGGARVNLFYMAEIIIVIIIGKLLDDGSWKRIKHTHNSGKENQSDKEN